MLKNQALVNPSGSAYSMRVVTERGSATLTLNYSDLSLEYFISSGPVDNLDSLEELLPSDRNKIVN